MYILALGLMDTHEKVVFSELCCFNTTSMENKFENCSFCTGICNAGGLFPIDTHNGVSMGNRPPAILQFDWSLARV